MINQQIINFDIKLGLKASASIQNGEKLSATVKDLDANIVKITLNLLSIDLSVINKGFSVIRLH